MRRLEWPVPPAAEGVHEGGELLISATRTREVLGVCTQERRDVRPLLCAVERGVVREERWTQATRERTMQVERAGKDVRVSCDKTRGGSKVAARARRLSREMLDRWHWSRSAGVYSFCLMRPAC